ncbi:MAG: zinc-binding dehydrogenase [Gammaproteobacteria bacterium]|nr:zinc-binding dehydrogenase [Gammaproteobacteria bacterium]
MMATPHFKIDGTPIHGFAGCGTFSDEMIVPASAAVKVEDDIPLNVVSLIGCGVTTGVGAAINSAKVTPGSSVVVFGCGGVGISAIQGARIAGAAEILAVDMIDSKLEMAKHFGATHVCTPDHLEGMRNEITAGEGFDFAIECIGNPKTIRAAYDNARRGGVACIVGVGRMEEMVQFSAFELFFADKQLKGSMYGGSNVRVFMPQLLRLWKQGKLDLESMVSKRMKVDDVNEAFRAMEEGEVIRTVLDFAA